MVNLEIDYAAEPVSSLLFQLPDGTHKLSILSKDKAFKNKASVLLTTKGRTSVTSLFTANIMATEPDAQKMWNKERTILSFDPQTVYEITMAGGIVTSFKLAAPVAATGKKAK